MGWRESYEKHLDTDYWLRVRRAVRRRATWRDGMVRCERCGSEEGPFDVHHTTEGYRYLGKELDHLDLMRYWCRACHEFRLGTVLTRRFRCPGENWKSGSNGFRAETQ